MKAYIVQRDKLRANIEIVRRYADGRIIYGVLKANGYGLGLIPLAHELRDCGISRFAVTEPADAVRLRLAGFVDEEILVMRSTAAEAEIDDILEARAVATIGSYEAAVVLNGVAERHGEIVEAHIKIDCGMGRYGFSGGETEKILSIFRFMPKIAVSGMYSHPSMASSSAKASDEQFQKFMSAVEAVRAAGFDPGLIHFANSSFLLRGDPAGTDAVRIGSAFLGRLGHGLQPVGYAAANVTEVRWLESGATVGYGGAWRAKGPTRIAVIPLGYADGFGITRAPDIFRLRDKLRYLLGDLRLFFSRRRLYVTVRGKRAQVLGHIGMAHTVINVTKLACEAGDDVQFEISPTFASPLLERIYI